MRRALGALTAAALAGAGVAAVRQRPAPHTGGAGDLDHLPTREEYLRYRAEGEGLFMTLARHIVIGGTVGLSRFWLHALNDYAMRDQEKLLPHVRDRPAGQPLITVANHTSTLDDPGLIATVLPGLVSGNPFHLRWAACSQEICFKNALVSTFFGAGKVLPIKRGAGIDQPLLEQLAHRLAAGDWVHIFPEGGVVQIGELGGRLSPRREEIGRLKWGVGKLIAEAEVTPVIVPFYHTGMHTIVPQDPETSQVINPVPGRGKKIRVLVGDPVDVADLLAQHREARALARAEADAAGVDAWVSTDADRALYSAITRRIEDALLELQVRCFAFADEDGPRFTEAPEAIVWDKNKAPRLGKSS